ncbi:hypothetical protein [Paenibacillus sp. IHB B 3415]|uniref:hypothetical protein n=1 Tax=Paenibacillus sp. IHB B 3415 TaxID=867080 RepID=UPI000ADD2086|nr:hypothetical protein [Paenibacillus sp. IHB B 3415]
MQPDERAHGEPDGAPASGFHNPECWNSTNPWNPNVFVLLPHTAGGIWILSSAIAILETDEERPLLHFMGEGRFFYFTGGHSYGL